MVDPLSGQEASLEAAFARLVLSSRKRRAQRTGVLHVGAVGHQSCRLAGKTEVRPFRICDVQSPLATVEGHALAIRRLLRERGRGASGAAPTIKA